jgi:hypothetical protein
MTSADMSPEEVERLRAEVAELRHKIEENPPRRPGAFRRFVAGFLAILAIVAIAASVDAVWLKTTLQDEDQFVATFQGLTKDEAVATALSVRVAEGIVEATGVQVFVADTLPPELSFAAAPISNAMEDLIARAAVQLIRSDAVNTAWSATLRATHVASSAVLSGNGGTLVAEDGTVALDLDEIATVVVDGVAEAGLQLPEVDTSFGQIVLYESDGLAAAQFVVQTIDYVGWILPIIALLLIVGAVLVAPDRRWIVAYLGFGAALGMLLSLVSLRLSRNFILDGIDDQVSRDAARAAWDMVTARLVAGSWGVLALAFVIGFVAWGVGPSPRAQRFSAWVGVTIANWRKPAEAEPSEFSRFLAGWKRTIQLIVVTVAALFLLFGPSLSGVRVLITTLIVVGIVVLVEIMAGPAEAPQEPSEAESDQVDADV